MPKVIFGEMDSHVNQSNNKETLKCLKIDWCILISFKIKGISSTIINVLKICGEDLGLEVDQSVWNCSGVH